MSHDLLQALMADVLAGKSGSDVVLVDLLQQYGASRETALDFIHGLRLGSELESTLRDSVSITASTPIAARLINVRPFTLYDTEEGGEAGSDFRYFRNFGFIRGARNGEMKMRDEANFTQPLRLPSNSGMKLRRLSATRASHTRRQETQWLPPAPGSAISWAATSPLVEVLPPAASVQLQLNRRDIWEGPLVDLLTPLGVPVRAECSDRDDINMRITWTQDGRGHFVRLNLHGWLKESIS